MFRGDLLIDGYNLLHAAGLARRSYGPGEFERCRQRLFKLLTRQLFVPERRRTSIVFDAPEQSIGPSPPRTVAEMLVIFADGPGDADDAIERLIQQNSAPKRLHVVSSDHRLQRAARRRRAKFYDSDDFLIRIIRRPSPDEQSAQAEPPEKQEGLTAPGDVEAWLQCFSDDVQSSLSEPRTSSQKPGDSQSAFPTQQSPARGGDRFSERVQQPTTEPNELKFWEQRVAELEEDRKRNP